ncbi:MAG: AAA family ATPase [Desulfitobacteriaceae bacterium]|nr:AAA family ATPase [Desulfitobacteriaceae bacterium]
MSSTTPNKKAIVDFLWEWTENHSDWSKLLINKIVAAESHLSTADRETVFNYFLQSINLHTGLPAVTVVKPTYTPTAKIIELNSLFGITGVNRLAKNQTVDFAKNVTIIYGENGTGKTGYCRILKTLGFSYDTNKTILPNIYAAPEPQAATINFKSNGEPRTFSWNGTNYDSELENISVFNSSCVQFSISDRSLIVTPIGFHLFHLVSDELNALTQLLQRKIAAHPITLIWIDNLTQGTPQHSFITNLSASSAEQKLTELSDFTPTHEASLRVKESELTTLNKALLQSQIQTLKNQITEIESIIGKVETGKTLINDTSWQAIQTINKEISELEKKSQTGLKEIADEKGVEFYQTTEFKSFIHAAENYIKIIDKPGYPNEGDTCVYCLQPLDNSAKDLLRSYRTLLNDNTQENLAELKKRKDKLIKHISQVDTILTFHQHTFGTDENQAPVQPKVIKDYNTNLYTLKTAFITDTVAQGSTFSFGYHDVIIYLTNKQTMLNTALTQKTEILANLADREAALRKEIAELKDRKFLSGKVSDIKNAIANHKVVNTLNANSSSFNTTSISRKTTSAREELVRQDFEIAFNKELLALRKPHLKVDLDFGTDRGNSKVYQKMSNHVLADILSEGEQKAIALAEFLTELQLANTKAPIVFDDPVNSLDHTIIDEVAKRLLKLSSERQIVIFTHSVLLFNSFLYFSKQATFSGLAYKFYNSKNEYLETGVITEAEEEINKVKSYISKVNTILNNTPRDREEADVAEDGYGFLRSAIELFVEHEIFQGTVKRYQKNIALTNFVKVDGALLDTHKDKLNEIFERCCGFIKGHSNPTEIHNDPTLAGLKLDFDEFFFIRDQFLN